MGKQGTKLLGVIIDRDMKFDEYVLIQCKKAVRKLCALGRVCTYLNLERRRSLMKAFIESQFAFYRLVWMFCSRSSNNRINQVHEGALRIVCNDNSSTFEDLLVKDNSVSTHHRNICLLTIALYKAKNDLSSQLMLELFQRREPCKQPSPNLLGRLSHGYLMVALVFLLCRTYIGQVGYVN